MVLVQKWPFLQFFFFRQVGQENVFYDILEQKDAFNAIKTRSSKSGKNDILPKGLTHSFGPKMAIFYIFLCNIGRENVFFNILDRKNAVLAYKKKKIKKAKN